MTDTEPGRDRGLIGAAPSVIDKGAGAHLSDAEIATRVRMLMRNDLDHEAVCTMARDRIRWLSAVNIDLLAALKTIADFYREGRDFSGHPLHPIARADAAIAKAEGRR